MNSFCVEVIENDNCNLRRGGDIIHSIINMFSGNISIYLPGLFLHLSAFNILNQNDRYTGGCVKVHISYSSDAR